MADNQTISLKFATDTASIDAATGKLTALTTTVADVGPKFRQAGDSARANAMGFLYLSQAIEDAQYGFGAIVNNIPMLVMAMGGGPGLAGAVSIAAVGVNVLARNWDNLNAAFGNSKVETEAERMERLAKATKLTADEAKELKRFEDSKAAQKRIENIGGAERDQATNALRRTVETLGGQESVATLFEEGPFGAKYRAMVRAAGGANEFTEGYRRKIEKQLRDDLDLAMGARGTPAEQQAARDRLSEIAAASPALTTGPLGRALRDNVTPQQEDAMRAKRAKDALDADIAQTNAKVETEKWLRQMNEENQAAWARVKFAMDQEEKARKEAADQKRAEAADVQRAMRRQQQIREAAMRDPSRFMDAAADQTAQAMGVNSLFMAERVRSRMLRGQGADEARLGFTEDLARNLFAAGQNEMGPVMDMMEARMQARRQVEAMAPEAGFLGQQMGRWADLQPRAIQVQERLVAVQEDIARRGVVMALPEMR